MSEGNGNRLSALAERGDFRLLAQVAAIFLAAGALIARVDSTNEKVDQTAGELRLQIAATNQSVEKLATALQDRSIELARLTERMDAAIAVRLSDLDKRVRDLEARRQ